MRDVTFPDGLPEPLKFLPVGGKNKEELVTLLTEDSLMGLLVTFGFEVYMKLEYHLRRRVITHNH